MYNGGQIIVEEYFKKIKKREGEIMRNKKVRKNFISFIILSLVAGVILMAAVNFSPLFSEGGLFSFGHKEERISMAPETPAISTTWEYLGESDEGLETFVSINSDGCREFATLGVNEMMMVYSVNCGVDI
ncbi:hypothetical protein KKG48_02740 [Patescibacteria group bacterium]|nr:hypothetical protein [Patescibacteria group bacterium]MCG2694636.1 hypothetical protein [Candidatus Parcubacteria bacterium]